jgi:GNAT superfamily N-acetyltransferase
MKIIEYHQDGYTISTDQSRIDIQTIHEYLSQQSYWAVGRPLDTVQHSIKHSLCFGVYQGTKQAGFARVVTDYATFAWLCDVFILENHRGQGLAKWLIETIVQHPDLSGLKLFLLATSDAHGLYKQYGSFSPLPNPEKWMVRINKG